MMLPAPALAEGLGRRVTQRWRRRVGGWQDMCVGGGRQRWGGAGLVLGAFRRHLLHLFPVTQLACSLYTDSFWLCCRCCCVLPRSASTTVV